MAPRQRGAFPLCRSLPRYLKTPPGGQSHPSPPHGDEEDEDFNQEKEVDTDFSEEDSVDSADDFGRRPTKSPGFTLSADKFCIEQWRHLRGVGEESQPPAKNGEEDNGRPRMDMDTTCPKGPDEWKKSIATMKRSATALTAATNSASFMSPKFPTCLIHTEPVLDKSKDFKTAKEKTTITGACGLAFIRCEELVHASTLPIMEKLDKILADDTLPDSLKKSL